ELRGIASVLAFNNNGGNDVCLYASHQVDLDPFSFFAGDAVLDIEPANEPGRAKARRIRSKGCLDRAHGQAAQLNQSVKDGCQRRVLKSVKDAVEVHQPAHMATFVSSLHFSHEPSRREQTVNLQGGSERLIGKRDRRTATPRPSRLGNGSAQV